MTTTRWQPVWNDFDKLQKRLNRLFDTWSAGVTPWLNLAATFPAVNLWEEGESIHVEAELPGLKQEDLEIYVSEGTQLTLQGERKVEVPGEGLWHRQERGFGKFSRTLTLPYPVDAEKVQARFDNGVLHITLPKSPEAKPRKITVQAN